MKKTILLLLLLMLPPMISYAHTFEADGIYYGIDYYQSYNYAFVTCQGEHWDDYSNEYFGEVVIPETVTYNNITYTVAGIGTEAFQGCTELTNVVIPNTVSSIGHSAFSGCSSLTDIVIPNSVTSIRGEAFFGCSSLTHIQIPGSVSHIEDGAFSGCSSLTSIKVASDNKYYDSRNDCNAIIQKDFNLLIAGCQNTIIPNTVDYIGSDAFYRHTGLISIEIPNSVKSINSSAFNGCTGLTSITLGNSVTTIGQSAFLECANTSSIKVENGNTVYDSRENCNALIETATNTILLGCHNTVIPNSVTSIGDYAFYDCSGLISITIPDAVTSIGNYAFKDCASLTNASIGNGVVSIGDNAFQECTGLSNVDIPNSVTIIGSAAFKGCSGLTSLTFGNSVRTIGSYSFEDCISLKKIDIPNSVTNILDRAFDGCTGLISITIGNGVNSIGKFTFSGCTGLTSVTIPNSVTSISEGAFYVCRSLTSIAIPNTVTSIERNAFQESGLIYVEIPNSVTSIGDWAFSYCSSLTKVTIPNSVTSIGNNAFHKSKNISTLIISGEGEWKGGAIDISTSRLCIDSPITSVNGMKITPYSDVYCYAAIPPSCDANSFTSYYGTLHVPLTSLASYFTAEHWCDFANIVGDAVEPNGLTMSCDSIEVQLGGENYILTATLSPANATPNDVTWRSTNTSIASVYGGTVYANGAGECDIIAECLNKKAMCHVVVKDTTVTISLDKQEVNVLPNHIITLTPSASPIMPSLSVSSSDPSVAATRVVNNKIQVVGIKEGTTTITVGSADGTAIPATCLVTVYTEPGDLNSDGFVTISDVTSLIDYLLGGDETSITTKNADVNGDGNISISDVTSLIDTLLSGN